MNVTSMGDLARGFALRNRNADLQRMLSRLGEEVASGRTADSARRLGGHMSHLAQIEHDLVLTASYGNGARQVQISATAMQGALERTGAASDALVGTLALASSGVGSTDISIAATEARGALETTVSALNTSAGGRHLFSGTEVDSAPLASAGDILTALRDAVETETSVGDVIAAAEAFFDTPGGGFETLIYRGADVGLSPVQLGAGESADLDLRADHPAFRATLRHMALAALADDAGLALPEAGRRALLAEAMDGLLTAKSAQTSVRADLGFAEERIEQARSRIETERGALELARNELLSVDPYQAATELQAVQQQLETLYTVTVRTSRLSLVNFLS